MIKTARLLIFSIVLLLGLVLIASQSFAFEFGGLNGTPGGTGMYGSPENIDWPPEFMAELEALQASVIKEVSQYQSWLVARTVQGRVTEKDGKSEKETNFFFGDDEIMPVGNPCSDSDAQRHAVASGVIDRTKQTKINRNGREITIFYEFSATVMGNGWNCEGKSGEAFWTDDESKKKHATDQNYIDDYLKKTKDLKEPALELDINSSYFIDLGLGQFKENLSGGKKFVEESTKQAQASPTPEPKESANTCSFTDPSDDGYALSGGGKDKLPAGGELVSVSINKRADESEVTFSTKGDIPKDGASGGASFTMALVTESGAPKFPSGHIWQGADAVVTFHTTKTDYEGSMFVLADNGQQVGIPFKPEYSVNGNTAKFAIPRKTVPPDKIKNMTILWEVASGGENFIDSIPEAGGKVTCQ